MVYISGRLTLRLAGFLRGWGPAQGREVIQEAKVAVILAAVGSKLHHAGAFDHVLQTIIRWKEREREEHI